VQKAIDLQQKDHHQRWRREAFYAAVTDWLVSAPGYALLQLEAGTDGVVLRMDRLSSLRVDQPGHCYELQPLLQQYLLPLDLSAYLIEKKGKKQLVFSVQAQPGFDLHALQLLPILFYFSKQAAAAVDFDALLEQARRCYLQLPDGRCVNLSDRRMFAYPRLNCQEQVHHFLRFRALLGFYELIPLPIPKGTDHFKLLIDIPDHCVPVFTEGALPVKHCVPVAIYQKAYTVPMDCLTTPDYQALALLNPSDCSEHIIDWQGCSVWDESGRAEQLCGDDARHVYDPLRQQHYAQLLVATTQWTGWQLQVRVASALPAEQYRKIQYLSSQDEVNAYLTIHAWLNRQAPSLPLTGMARQDIWQQLYQQAAHHGGDLLSWARYACWLFYNYSAQADGCVVAHDCLAKIRIEMQVLSAAGAYGRGVFWQLPNALVVDGLYSELAHWLYHFFMVYRPFACRLQLVLQGEARQLIWQAWLD
jgi:hypothetical protein